MTSSTLANLLKLVGSARDGALLRFSLGNEYLKLDDRDNAILQLQEAVVRDPGYSAAWKLLGRALADEGRDAEALDAWQRGIAVAGAKGDKQAAKEMTVFARRIERKSGGPDQVR